MIPSQLVPTIQYVCQQQEEVKTLRLWRFHPKPIFFLGNWFYDWEPSFSMNLALPSFTKFNIKIKQSNTKIILLRQLRILLFRIWLISHIELLLWHLLWKKKNKQTRVHFCPLVFVMPQWIVYWKRFHNSVIRKSSFYAPSSSNVLMFDQDFDFISGCQRYWH